MPACCAIALRGTEAVAGQHDDRDTEAPELVNGRGGGLAESVRDGDDAREGAIDGDVQRGLGPRLDLRGAFRRG